jgi:hypothetical protein
MQLGEFLARLVGLEFLILHLKPLIQRLKVEFRLSSSRSTCTD